MNYKIRRRLKIWLRAIRPFAFSASIIPVLLAASMAFFLKEETSWLLLPIVLICAMLFHAGVNVISEYYDFKEGVDRKDTFGSNNVLVDGLESPPVLLSLGYILLLIGLLAGSAIIFMRGLPMLILVIVGLFGGIFYTSRPLGYKYIGLGDIMVFLLMGPLMVIGSFFALTGNYDPLIFYVSLPVGFLVCAILSSNNLRDIKHDADAGIRTLEIALGKRGAGVLNLVLIGSAYLSVIIMVVLRMVNIWSFLVFLSMPIAIRNIRVIIKGGIGESRDVATIDIFSAQLHMVFGILFIISIIIQGILREGGYV